MNKFNLFSKELEALPVNDFVNKVDRLWTQKKQDDSLLEKRLGKSVADSARRFLADKRHHHLCDQYRPA